MNIIDEEESKRTGQTVYKHVEVQGSANAGFSAGKITAGSGEKIRSKPVKEIEHHAGPRSSYSMIRVRNGDETTVLQIAWKKDGTLQPLHCKNCDIDWKLQDTTDYSEKFDLQGTKVTCKKCGRSGDHAQV